MASGYVPLDGTCGDVCVAMQSRFLEILDFTLFFDHFIFTPNVVNVLEKELKREIPVSVGIELVSGDMSENDYFIRKIALLAVKS